MHSSAPGFPWTPDWGMMPRGGRVHERGASSSWSADERDAEVGRLRAKVGELTMEDELLRERARRAFKGRYITEWAVERHGHQTPAAVRAAFAATAAA